MFSKPETMYDLAGKNHVLECLKLRVFYFGNVIMLATYFIGRDFVMCKHKPSEIAGTTEYFN